MRRPEGLFPPHPSVPCFQKQGVVDPQGLGTDPHDPSPLERLEHARLRDLNHVGHLVRRQATKRSEDRQAVGSRDIYTVERDDV
jgi:hypothetical protein